MADSISRDHVAHIARLARLELSPEELETFTTQLASVLDHFHDIDSLELGDVTPMTHPYHLVNVLREDRPGPTLDRDEVLAQAPAAEDRRFAVPPILGVEP